MSIASGAIIVTIELGLRCFLYIPKQIEHVKEYSSMFFEAYNHRFEITGGSLFYGIFREYVHIHIVE